MSTSVGETYVTIRPDLDGFREELDAGLEEDMEGTAQTVEIDADTDDFDVKLAASKAALRESFGGQTYSATLGIDDTELAARLDEDVARIDELSNRVYSIKVDAADEDARAKLDALKAEVDDLTARVYEPELGLEGDERVRAEMDDLELKLDEFGARDVHARVKVDTGSSTRDLDGVAEAAENLIGSARSGGGGSGLSGAGAAADEAGEGLSGLAEAALYASPLLVPLGAGVTALLGGLLSLGTGAAVGLGAFGLAIGSTATKFEAEADKILKSWQTAMAPFVRPVLADFVKLVGPLLSELSPIVEAVAGALRHVAGAVQEVIGSSAFAGFIGFLSQEAPQAIEAFATALINIGEGFAGIVEAFGPFSQILAAGIDSLTGKFASFGQGLAGSAGFQSFLAYVRQNGPLIGTLLSELARTLGGLFVALAPLGSAMLRLLDAILPILPPLTRLVGLFADIVAFAIDKLLPVVDLIVRGFLDASGAVERFADNWRTELDEVQAVWQTVSQFLTSSWSSFTQTVSSVWSTIGADITGAWDAVFGENGTVRTVWDDISAWLGNVWKTFTSTVTAAWHQITSPVTAAWDAVFGSTGAIETAWTATSGFLTRSWGTFAAFVTAIWGNAKDGTGIVGTIGSAWQDLVGVIGSVWDAIGEGAADGLNAVIDVINGFIGFVDRVASDVGAGKNLIGTIGHVSFTGGGIQTAADGATIGAGFMTKGPTVLVGEGNPAYPEFVIPTDPQYAGNARTLLANAAGMMGYASGGIIGDLGSAASAVGSAISGVVGDVTGLARNLLAEGVRTVLGPEKAVLDTAASALPGPLGPIVEGSLNELFDDIANYLAGKQTAQQASQARGGPIPTGAHASLIAQALSDAGVPVTAANEDAVNIIVTHESGWNPNAINLSDSNAAAGDPSRGLMQTIMTTFDAYRLPGLPDDIYNPVSNIVAGVRYAIARYGSLQNVPGVRSVDDGGGYVGYRAGGVLGRTVPFQLLDQGGWLPPGLSMVLNNTGAPEHVPGPGGSGGYSPVYNIDIGGNVTAETMQIVQSTLDAHDQALLATLNAGNAPMTIGTAL